MKTFRKSILFICLCIACSMFALFATGCDTDNKSGAGGGSSAKASSGLWLEKHGDGRSYIVSGIGSCEDTDIVIPSSYNGLPVASIKEEAFFNCGTIVSVVVPDSVKTIGEKAFGGCGKLESITLPFIGQSKDGTENTKFSYIFGTVPDTLKSFTIPDGTTKIPSSAFSGCKSLESITIPESVTEIGTYAFSGCSITSMSLPSKVTEISDGMFFNCEKLTSFIIPETITKIGRSAFYSSGLTSITVPKTVTSIGEFAFYDCENLTDVVIDGASYIGKSVFAHIEKLKNVTLSDGVLEIGEGAFNGCESIEKIVIPNTVTSVGKDAFMYCDSLESVTLSNKMTEIAEHSFAFCKSLKSIKIPSSVKKISGYAFSLTEFTSVTFENTSSWYKLKSNDENDIGELLDVTNPVKNAENINRMVWDWVKK